MRGISFVLLLGLFPAASGITFHPGRNSISLRGEQQDIYYFPPAAGRARATVLFTPGDGGWRGMAVDVANKLASWGYRVFGWDTKRYLRGFTNGAHTLSESDISRDFLTVARLVDPQPGSRVLLVGWSQGAAMSVIPAASPAGRNVFRGLLLIGLPRSGVLGWRWKDDLSYVTKSEPDEPRFETVGYLRELAPLPICVVQGGNDEYTPPQAIASLYQDASSPKRLLVVAGAHHNFSGHESEFYARLQEGLEWIEHSQPHS
jgi:fermentation-respiration switch protein FrsA (DUF1100 family)